MDLMMVAGADLRHVILRLCSYDANCVVSSLWGGTSTFDLFQFTDKHSNPLVLRRQSLRISLRYHHHQVHGCIPCRGFLPSGPTCGPYFRAEYGWAWKTKKPLNLTPVEEPRLVGGATPFGVGIRLNGFHASASTPSICADSINTSQDVSTTNISAAQPLWDFALRVTNPG